MRRSESRKRSKLLLRLRLRCRYFMSSFQDFSERLTP
jgi:hypothetical protein